MFTELESRDSFRGLLYTVTTGMSWDILDHYVGYPWNPYYSGITIYCHRWDVPGYLFWDHYAAGTSGWNPNILSTATDT